MPTNLEIKVKVANHNSFKKLLRQIGADYKGILNQKDIYYNTKNSLLKLRLQNTNNELIKYNRDETGKNRWSDYEIITLIGKNPEAFFNSLFKVETSVSKKRELWLYNNTRIHLDTVRNLGKFLELETIVVGNKIEAQKRFNLIMEKLDLFLSKPIKCSYRDLMLRLKTGE